jgi:hypothetical protein
VNYGTGTECYEAIEIETCYAAEHMCQAVLRSRWSGTILLEPEPGQKNFGSGAGYVNS